MRLIFSCLIAFICATLACAEEPHATRESFAKVKRQYDHVPVDAFQFLDPDQYDIKLWATSPLVFSPVSMDIDSQGRVWLTEGSNYKRKSMKGEPIVVVTDTDGDGVADKSHTFVMEKNARHAPLGITVFDNKIILAATPDLIVYTDNNRNAIFDEGDTREVFLTGFLGKGHDHSLHGIVGSPSGQYYFSFGNCGADIKTKDGKHFLLGSYYMSQQLIGKRSSDGHLYVGGAAMRVNQDGTELSVVGHNLRNTMDMAVTSFGDVLQSDNDDPAHCRITWQMEYGNLGYADPRDGSKSWEEVGKSWEEPKQKGRNRYSTSHWRQNYPGTMPPGGVYGAGSPIGNVFIEDDSLGEENRGLYLVCDMVRKAIIGHHPKLKDAQIDVGDYSEFISLKKQKELLLPTDLALGPDGALYLSDFYNSTSRRTVELSGAIYRITRKGRTYKQPAIDFSRDDGLLEALKNPSSSVRMAAVTKLLPRADKLVSKLKQFHQQQTNPYIKARAIWLLAASEDGRSYVDSLLEDKDEKTRLTSYRALRQFDPAGLLKRAATKVSDASPAVRREVALSLRDVPLEKSGGMLKDLIDGYDGKNRWYLEAIGSMLELQEDKAYKQIIRPLLPSSPASWNEKAVNLAWRMHTPEAIKDLNTYMLGQDKPVELDTFRRLLMAHAMYRTEAQRVSNQTDVEHMLKSPLYAGEDYQLTINEILNRDLRGLKAEMLNASYPVPTQLGAETKLSDIQTIAKLPGDKVRGQTKVQVCYSCHKISGTGVTFGPNLTNWGQTRTIEQIVKDMVDPSAHLAHGYDKMVEVANKKHKAQGLLINYSHHAGSLKMRLFGGEVKKILFRRSGAKTKYLKKSWMPPASKMGLSDQDVRDIAEYLKTLGK